MKKCSFCAEEILEDAKKCKYCGEFLDEKLRKQSEKYVQKKSSGTATVLSCLFMGLGQIYNGQIGKGFLFVFLYGASLLWIFFAGIGGLVALAHDGRSASLAVLIVTILLSVGPTIALWIFGMLDARTTAIRINKGELKE